MNLVVLPMELEALHTDSLEPTKIENTVSDNLAFGNFQQKNSN